MMFKMSSSPQETNLILSARTSAGLGRTLVFQGRCAELTQDSSELWRVAAPLKISILRVRKNEMGFFNVG